MKVDARKHGRASLRPRYIWSHGIWVIDIWVLFLEALPLGCQSDSALGGEHQRDVDTTLGCVMPLCPHHVVAVELERLLAEMRVCVQAWAQEALFSIRASRCHARGEQRLGAHGRA